MTRSVKAYQHPDCQWAYHIKVDQTSLPNSFTNWVMNWFMMCQFLLGFVLMGNGTLEVVNVSSIGVCHGVVKMIWLGWHGEGVAIVLVSDGNTCEIDQKMWSGHPTHNQYEQIWPSSWHEFPHVIKPDKSNAYQCHVAHGIMCNPPAQSKHAWHTRTH